MFKNFLKNFDNPQEELINQKESINPIKSEHLREGIKPIMACVGTPDDFPEPIKKVMSKENKLVNVNFYENFIGLSLKRFKNAGEYSYVISNINNKNKFSECFLNCTGLIVAGFSKKTNENISFVSHQNPGFFLESENNKKKFSKDLRQRLLKLKDKSLDKTIDAVIVGGNYFSQQGKVNEFGEDYFASIKLLSEEVLKILGFEPVVIIGPKIIDRNHGDEDIFYDNKNRQLYIVRLSVDNKTAKSFIPSDLEEQSKNWDKDKF
ncbi:MAG: hypothetical protein PHW15_00165 [Patescibacteria group bacterium]|jgi:hypothetical protein|nr:hypothetical protein [Patescibacteria group bacterium]MDD5172660.1 hypothetical protein [Patescibacteria group bacterium]